MFVLEGAHGRNWHVQSCGLAQGCPFSPFLAAAITHCWGCFVLSPHVSGFGFLHDRTLILKAGSDSRHMREALGRSEAFDSACGFQVAADKCHLAAMHLDARAQAIARDSPLAMLPAV